MYWGMLKWMSDTRYTKEKNIGCDTCQHRFSPPTITISEVWWEFHNEFLKSKMDISCLYSDGSVCYAERPDTDNMSTQEEEYATDEM